MTATGRLHKAGDALARSFERLSSGQRINRASDDAAGLAIATGLASRQRVFSRALINANDAVSMLNIAGSSAGALTTILERLKELATQSANGSLSRTQRVSLNEEAESLVAEYNRVIGSTSFNGRKLHASGQGDTRFQLGFGSSGTIGVGLAGGLEKKVGSGSFDTPIASAAVASRALATGDVTGDGIPDLITVQTASSAIAIRAGRGDGTFDPATTLDYGLTVTALELADMTGDGLLDIVIGTNVGMIRTIRSNGGGSFSALSFGAANDEGNAVNDIAIGDFNGDGKLDVAATTSSTFDPGFVAVLTGNGSGVLTRDTLLGASIAATGGSIAVGDFNGDGKDDIAATNGTFSLGIFYNTHSGTGGSTSFATTSIGANAPNLNVVSADLNNDGLDDIITQTGNSTYVMLRQDAYSFAEGERYAVGNDVGIADVNNDGILDLFGISSSSRLAVAYGQGKGLFGDSVLTPFTGADLNIGAADLNGDGVLDFVSGGGGGSRVLLQGVTQSTELSYINLSSQEGARSALSEIETAQARVSNELGAIGAGLSRIESAIRTLQESEATHAAAVSRIKDVDTAAETATLLRLQITQDAAAAILAQANQAPALALMLLSNIQQQNG